MTHLAARHSARFCASKARCSAGDKREDDVSLKEDVVDIEVVLIIDSSRDCLRRFSAFFVRTTEGPPRGFGDLELDDG